MRERRGPCLPCAQGGGIGESTGHQTLGSLGKLLYPPESQFSPLEMGMLVPTSELWEKHVQCRVCVTGCSVREPGSPWLLTGVRCGSKEGPAS